MIRVVLEISPTLCILIPAEEADIQPTLEVGGHDGTFYRVQTKAHYVFYRRAISGDTAGGTFNEGQR